ncbi:MAG: YiiX/YebB-like N1pC/P60 family cysteine hydrolase [Bdellovibrio sp.]
MSLRTDLLGLSIPIQKEMQKLHPPEPKTTVRMVEAVMPQVRDGDILLSREAWHFTNNFIPGYWSHAAIYGQGQVVEAVAPAVQVVDDFRDWAVKKHNWCVLRPMTTEQAEGALAFFWAESQIGKLYDYRFSKNNGLFFCSELVFDAWDMTSRWGEDVFVKRLTFGEWTVTPDDFYNAVKRAKLKLIFEHRD